MAFRTKDFFTGDGVTTLFSFTFPYINESDVKVKLDFVVQPTTEYTLANPTTVSFSTPPADGVEIEIYRDSQIDTPLNTFFPGSAIRAKDLNDNFTQTLYITQESTDDTENSEELAEIAIQRSTEALETANAADTKADTALTTANNADGKADTAVSTANAANTKADQAVSTANAADSKVDGAVSDAATAVSTANAADAKADTAIATANAADATANNAESVALGIEGKADTAIATANAADTKADGAVATANSANSKATAAQTTANAADGKADTAVNTANTAKSTADTAKSTADTAKSTADTALSTANSADSRAGTAISTANAASATANAAQTTANAANSKADAAVNTANEALTLVSADGPWVESGGNVTLRNGGDLVGIGTSPAAKLDIKDGTSRALFREGQQSMCLDSVTENNDDFDDLRFRGNNITFQRGSSELVRITPTGKVGIGTSSPGAALHVDSANATPVVIQSSDSQSLINFRNSSSSLFYMGASSNNWNVQSGGVERLSVTTGGKVGIGTNGPAHQLDVAGDARIKRSSSNDGALYFGATGSDNNFIYGNSDVDVLTFTTKGNERVRIKDNGNVGINTSQPGELLDLVKSGVSGDISSYRQFRVGHTTNQGYSGYIGYGQAVSGQRLGLFLESYDNGNTSPISLNPTGGYVGIGTTNPGQKLVVSEGGAQGLEFRPTSADRFILAGYNRNTSSYIQLDYEGNGHVFKSGTSEKVRITSAGNVGIGTTSPITALDVFGAPNTTFTSSPFTQRLYSTSTSGQNIGGGISFGGKWNGASNQYADFGLISGVKENATAGNYAGALTFATRKAGSGPGNLERMRITSNGDVGIGTDTPNAKLAIAPGGTQYVRVGATQALMLEGTHSGGAVYFGSTAANPTGGIESSWDAANNNPSVSVGVLRDGNGAQAGPGKPHTQWSYSNEIKNYVGGSQVFTINTGGAVLGAGKQLSLPGGGGANQALTKTEIETLIGVKNVKSFGAKGDGTSDDTTAIQNALNSGGTIYFPKGTYRVTNTITVTNKPVRMVGDGNGSVILCDPVNVNVNCLRFLYNFGGPSSSSYYAISDLNILIKENKNCNEGIHLEYTGASGVVGSGNSLTLNNVTIGSVFTNDANTGYFTIGLFLQGASGVVGNNVTIGSYAKDKVSYGNPNSIGINISNAKNNHFMIRTLSLTNVYIHRYHTGIKAGKTGTGGNIESIYLSQGEILASKGVDISKGDANYFSGLHMDVRDYAFKLGTGCNTTRILGCDIRAQRNEAGSAPVNGTEGDWLMHLRGNGVVVSGCDLLSFMPRRGAIIVGNEGSSPENINVVGNWISGNLSSAYLAIKCDNGANNVVFGGNTLSQFGGNNSPWSDDTGGQLYTFGQR